MESEVPTPWHETRWARGLAVLVAVGIAVGIWAVNQPSLPDQREAEQAVAADVGRSEHTTVTATCTVPHDSGYTCRLRDAAGRYGYSITTFHEDSPPTYRRITTRYGLTTWDFPLDADGRGTTTLDVTPPRDLSLSITAVLLMISGSIGEDSAFSLQGAIDCADPVAGEVTTCTVRAPVRSASVRVSGENEYLLTYRVALP